MYMCIYILIYIYYSPGSTLGKCTVDQSRQNISDCINSAHSETTGVTCVIENMVCLFASWYYIRNNIHYY